jgi:hypothetical protein
MFDVTDAAEITRMFDREVKRQLTDIRKASVKSVSD